ncbi:unnamed protein product [Peniophora sp. CBMAI 1063]|nr:unnamed protein product [Peniophora sp. CBMAI 1063]
MSARSRSSSPSNSDSDSDIEFTRELSKGQLIENGHRLEKKLVDARDDLTKLTNRVTELEATQGRGNGKRTRDARRTAATDAGKDGLEAVKEAGMRVAQKFVIAYNLFLANGVRCNVDRDTDYNLTAANRYCDSEGLYQGQLRDLEEIIPAEWKEIRKTSASFQSSFHSQQGETRTGIARRIAKSQATADIFPMFDARSLRSSAWRKENCREYIGYRADWGDGRAGYSALDAAIIHEKHQAPDGYDLDTIFKGEVPQRCLAAVLFGPAGVRAMADGGHPRPATSEYMGRLIGAKFTTPGMMALGCTLACWGLSEDSSLAEVDTTDEDAMTGINWATWFNDYKQEIEEGIEEKRPQILAAFRMWDERLFPATASQGLGVSELGPSQSGPSIRDAAKARARAQKAAASRAANSTDTEPQRRGGRRVHGQQNERARGGAEEGEGQSEEEDGGAGPGPSTREGRRKRRADQQPEGAPEPPQKQVRQESSEESSEEDET